MLALLLLGGNGRLFGGIPRFDEFDRRTHRTQRIIIFTAMNYYSKKNSARSAKGKDTWDEVWRKLDTSF